MLISEFASPVGTPGDLIAVDLSQYLFTWMRYPSGAGLSFDFQPVTDQWHQGLIGMPEGSTDIHLGDEFLFDRDEISLKFKLRGDGRFIWASTMTLTDGTVVGPASVVAQR